MYIGTLFFACYILHNSPSFQIFPKKKIYPLSHSVIESGVLTAPTIVGVDTLIPPTKSLQTRPANAPCMPILIQLNPTKRPQSATDYHRLFLSRITASTDWHIPDGVDEQGLTYRHSGGASVIAKPFCVP